MNEPFKYGVIKNVESTNLSLKIHTIVIFFLCF